MTDALQLQVPPSPHTHTHLNWLITGDTGGTWERRAGGDPLAHGDKVLPLWIKMRWQGRTHVHLQWEMKRGGRRAEGFPRTLLSREPHRPSDGEHAAKLRHFAVPKHTSSGSTGEPVQVSVPTWGWRLRFIKKKKRRGLGWEVKHSRSFIDLNMIWQGRFAHGPPEFWGKSNLSCGSLEHFNYTRWIWTWVYRSAYCNSSASEWKHKMWKYSR